MLENSHRAAHTCSFSPWTEYGNGQTVYNLYNGQNVSQNWYLDQVNLPGISAPPVGYYGAVVPGFTPFTSAFTSGSPSVTVNMGDSPQQFVPMSLNNSPLVSQAYDLDFQLDVAAQTLAPGGNQSFWMEATATGLGSSVVGQAVSWAFLANGEVVDGAWQLRAGGGIGAPSAWTATTCITQCVAGAPIMSSVVTLNTISFSPNPQ